MTVTYDAAMEEFTYAPPPAKPAVSPWYEVRETAAERGFAAVAEAFPILGEFRLLVSTGSPSAHVALASLMTVVRWDTWDGHRVGVAAEAYLNGSGSWRELQIAFAAWANLRIVRMADLGAPAEWLPLEESELWGEVA